MPTETTAVGVEEKDELPEEERTTRSTGSEATERKENSFLQDHQDCEGPQHDIKSGRNACRHYAA